VICFNGNGKRGWLVGKARRGDGVLAKNIGGRVEKLEQGEAGENFFVFRYKFGMVTKFTLCVLCTSTKLFGKRFGMWAICHSLSNDFY
jgi:hypothetical protein